MYKSFKVAPLPSSLMLFSIIGFLISVFLIYPKSTTWGFNFMFFSGIVFIASLISMTYAPLPYDHPRKKKK